MKERIKLYIMAIIAVFVAITLIWYAKAVALQGDMVQALSAVIIVLMIAIGFIWYGFKEHKKQKKRASKDKSSQVAKRAAAYAYFFSIWYLVGLVWYVTMGVEQMGLEALTAQQALGCGIIGMAVIFVLCYLYFKLRGEL